jgi:hypothetical protein
LQAEGQEERFMSLGSIIIGAAIIGFVLIVDALSVGCTFLSWEEFKKVKKQLKSRTFF